jgi:hypothetical protein
LVLTLVRAAGALTNGDLDKAVALAMDAVDLAGPLQSSTRYLTDFYDSLNKAHARHPLTARLAERILQHYPNLTLGSAVLLSRVVDLVGSRTWTIGAGERDDQGLLITREVVLCCCLRLFSRGGQASTLDGLCDLQGGLSGREVRGIDDLGLAVQPRAGRLGVGLKVFETESGGDGSGPLNAPAEGVLVSVEDEVPYRNGMLGETRADLAPVLLDQDSHGHHQSAARVVEYVAGGVDYELPPRRPVLEVIRPRQPWRDVHECLADLLGVEHP